MLDICSVEDGYKALCISVLLQAFDDLTVWKYDNTKKKLVPDILMQKNANQFFQNGEYELWAHYLGYEYEFIIQKWKKLSPESSLTLPGGIPTAAKVGKNSK